MFQHSKGEWARQRFSLEPWQRFVVGSVYGWLREDGTRRFRRVYEEIPRKNGKSTKLAGVALKQLLADDEPGAEVYAAATRKEQARIIFNEAKRMAKASTPLRSRLQIFKHNMSVDDTNSMFEPLSADARTLDGLNPSAVLIDELHKHQNSSVVDVLDSATGSRRQPILWMITTAGDDDPETVYAAEHDYAIQILDRVQDDDSTFVFISTIDKDDKWDDPLAWAKANPNLGVSVKLDYLKDQARKAKSMPRALVTFMRLHLNVRTADTTKAIDAELWAENGLGHIDPASLRGRPCFTALDLSSKIDITACIRLFAPLEPGERWKILARFWMPEADMDAKSDRDRAPYRQWVNDGWMHATVGNVVDQEQIFKTVIEDCRETPPQDLAIDPWNAYGLIPQFQNEGIEVFEFTQGLKSYTAPTKELMSMLKTAKIDHGNNPVLTWMASNLHIQLDKNENQMPTKKHSRGRIDGMTALIMAIGRTMVGKEPAPMIIAA